MKRKNLQTSSNFLFGKKNYLFMLVGIAFIGLGFILMAGGGSDDPEVFKMISAADTVGVFQVESRAQMIPGPASAVRRCAGTGRLSR